MNPNKHTKKDLGIFIGAILILAFAFFVMIRILPMYLVKGTSTVPPTTPSSPVNTVPPSPNTNVPTPAETQTVNPDTGPYSLLTLKTKTPLKELEDAVGQDNVDTVLRLNRIDSQYLVQGSTLTIPQNMSDFMALSPFPTNLPLAQSIPKLMLVSQRVQAFGVYENGVLVRWGPVSTGKESTPTANRLYFTNWKGKLIHSSVNDEWILKWDFNLDNKLGISMHQYEMPGYPASHSCIRLSAVDAQWLYNWADQWIVSPDQNTLLANGTPVIVFGNYAYGKKAPWKNLSKDPTATNVSVEELTTALTPYTDAIQQASAQRSVVTATKTQ